MRKNNKGFTIVELLIAIVIFTLGLISAYLLVYTALSSAQKSKNEIIAANLARESIELIKNNRDTNWSKMLIWNKLDNSGKPGDFLTGGYYIIENDFSTDTTTSSSIKIEKLSDSFDGENNKYLLSSTVSTDETNLCLDSLGRYTHTCSGGNKSTHFYSYLKVEQLKTKDSGGNEIIVNDTFKITSDIVNSERGFTRYAITTIITDWKK